MTLRGRLTAAFLAVVLGPVLLGAFFVGATVATVSRERLGRAARLAATTVRTSVGALCQQLHAAADAVAVAADSRPAARRRRPGRRPRAGRGVTVEDPRGGVVIQTPGPPPKPWADCAGTATSAGAVPGLAVRVEMRDASGGLLGVGLRRRSPSTRRSSAGSRPRPAPAVTLLGSGPRPSAVRDAPSHRGRGPAASSRRPAASGRRDRRGRYVRRVEPVARPAAAARALGAATASRTACTRCWSAAVVLVAALLRRAGRVVAGPLHHPPARRAGQRRRPGGRRRAGRPGAGARPRRGGPAGRRVQPDDPGDSGLRAGADRQPGPAPRPPGDARRHPVQHPRPAPDPAGDPADRARRDRRPGRRGAAARPGRPARWSASARRGSTGGWDLPEAGRPAAGRPVGDGVAAASVGRTGEPRRGPRATGTAPVLSHEPRLPHLRARCRSAPPAGRRPPRLDAAGALPTRSACWPSTTGSAPTSSTTPTCSRCGPSPGRPAVAVRQRARARGGAAAVADRPADRAVELPLPARIAAPRGGAGQPVRPHARACWRWTSTTSRRSTTRYGHARRRRGAGRVRPPASGSRCARSTWRSGRAARSSWCCCRRPTRTAARSSPNGSARRSGSTPVSIETAGGRGDPRSTGHRLDRRRRLSRPRRPPASRCSTPPTTRSTRRRRPGRDTLPAGGATGSDRTRSPELPCRPARARPKTACRGPAARQPGHSRRGRAAADSLAACRSTTASQRRPSRRHRAHGGR